MIFFFLFLNKTYFVGCSKDEAVLLSTQQNILKLMAKKIITYFCAQKVHLAGPTTTHTGNMAISCMSWREIYFFRRHLGAQWLNGGVLDSRQRGHGFKPPWPHCVVSLSKTHLSMLSTGSTQEDLSQHNCKIIDWDVESNQTKLRSHLYQLHNNGLQITKLD